MTTYSHSRLSTFEKCPFLFKLKYVDRIKVDVPTTVEMFLGSTVHKALEKLYVDLQHEKKTSLEELLKFYGTEWKNNWDEKILIVADYSQENYRAMGEKYLADYYNHYFPFDRERILGVETTTFLKLDEASNYHIRIDLLSRKGDTFFVRDFKTSGRLPDQSDLDADRQLAMYSLWVHKKFPKAKDIKLVWNFLRFDTEMSSVRTLKQLNQLKADVLSLIKKIESTKSYPTQPNRHCNWCLYQKFCPHYAHKFAVEKPSSFSKDDGAKLVDQLEKADKQLRLTKQEVDTLKERIAAYAKQFNYESVFGSNKKATITEKESIKLPPKANQAELIAKLKSLNLWDDFSTLDTFRLKKELSSGALPDLESFTRKEKTTSVRLLKKD